MNSSRLLNTPVPPGPTPSAAAAIAKIRLKNRLVKGPMHQQTSFLLDSSMTHSSLDYATPDFHGSTKIGSRVIFSAENKEANFKPESQLLELHTKPNIEHDSFTPISAINLLVSGDRAYIYLTPDHEIPYKLWVLPDSVDRDSFQGELITLSRHGIVREEGGVKMHFTLKEYISEYTCCQALMRIPVFGAFRKWKSFKVWKTTIKYKIFKRRAAALESQLIVLDNHLGVMLRFVHDKCIALERLKVFREASAFQYNMPEFVQMQKYTVEIASAEKASIIKSIIEYIKKAGELWLLGNFEHMPSNSALVSNRERNLTLIEADSSIYESKLVPNITIPKYKPDIKMNSTTSKFIGNISSVSQTKIMRSINTANSKFHQNSAEESSMNMYGTDNSHDSGLTYTDRSFFRIKGRRFLNLLFLSDFKIQQALYSCVEFNLERLLIHWNAQIMLESRSNTNKILSLIEKRKSGKEVFYSVTPGQYFNLREGVKYGLISIQLVLEERKKDLDSSPNIALSIPSNDLTEFILSVFDGIVFAASYVTPMVYSPEFAILLLPVQSDIAKVDLQEFVATDKNNSVNYLFKQCMEILTRDVKLCEGIVKLFRPLLEKYKWALALAESISDPMISKMSLIDLSELLYNLSGDMAEFRELPQNTDCGMFRVELQLFVREVLEQYQRCVDLFSVEIPAIYVKRGSKLVDYVISMYQSLTKNPKNVEDFVGMLECYNSITKVAEEQQDESLYLTGLKFVMEDHSISLSAEATDLSSTLNAGYTRYLQATNIFRDHLSERLEFYRKELAEKVKLVKKPLDEINNRLCSEIITDPMSRCSDALKELDGIKISLRTVTLTTASLIRCQRAMDAYVFDEASAQSVQLLLDSNLVLWASIDSIKINEMEFFGSGFRTANCEKFLSLLFKIQREISRFDFQNVRVKEYLDAMLKEKYEIIPVIQYLQTDVLFSRHKLQINTVVDFVVYTLTEITDQAVDNLTEILKTTGNNLKQQSALTIREIIKHKIHLKAAEIKEIIDVAVAENYVAKALRDAESVSNSISFELVRMKNDQSIYTFRNLEEVSVYIDDLIISVESAMKSPHCLYYMEIATRLLGDLNNWKLTIASIIHIQKTYFQFRKVFTSARSSRQFQMGLRFFTSIEDNWKFITSQAAANSAASYLLTRPGLKEAIDVIMSIVTKAAESIDVQVCEMRSKWPKLYLLPKETILNISCMQHLSEIFINCHILLPNITSFHFDGTDAASTIAACSGSEEIYFGLPVSARNSVGDWLQGVEEALREQLKSDINDLIENPPMIFEDNGTDQNDIDQRQQWCNQSKLVALQLEFWVEFWQYWDSKEKIKDLNKLLKKLNARVPMFLDTIKNAKSRHLIIGNSNLLLMIHRQIEIVKRVIDFLNETNGSDSFPFFLDCTTQVLWIASEKVVGIRLGGYSAIVPYGFHYAGMHERIALTPLSERCMLALANAVCCQHVFPFVTGPDSKGNNSLLADLACEYGQEYIQLDCAKLQANNAITSISDFMSCVLGCGSWANIHSIDALKPEAFSVLMTSLSVIQTAFISGIGQVTYPTTIQYLSSPYGGVFPKIFLSASNSNNFPGCKLYTASLRKQFQPITISKPEYKIIIEMLLLSYNFGDLANILAVRMYNFCFYLAVNCLINDIVVMNGLIQSIRRVGVYLHIQDNAMAMESVGVILRYHIKLIIFYYRSVIGIPILKFACNTFLSLGFEGTFDVRELKEILDSNHKDASTPSKFFDINVKNIRSAMESGPTVKLTVTSTYNNQSRRIDIADKLELESPHFCYPNNHSVIICGAVGTGKSMAIKKAVSDASGVFIPAFLFDNIKSAKSNLPRTPTGNQQHRGLNAKRKNILSPSSISNIVTAPYPSCIYSELFNLVDEQNELSDIATEFLILAMSNRFVTSGDEALVNDHVANASYAVVHMDSSDSSTLSYELQEWEIAASCSTVRSLLYHTGEEGLYRSRVRIFWECTELSHLDPGMGCSTPIVYIANKLYDPVAVLQSSINSCCEE